MTTPVIKRDEFTTWLESFNPRKVVGRRGAPGGCPIASYLTQHFGLADVEVIYGSYSYTNDKDVTKDKKMANWVGEFIEGIDGEDMELSGPVTAKQALTILAGVRRS